MITPQQLVEKGKGSEHAHQCAVMQWIAVEGRRLYPGVDLLFAVPNGGERNIIVAAAMKAEGVKSGVPDLMLPVPKGRYAGLWIEMKKPDQVTKPDGGRSQNQATWHKRLIAQGYAVVVCYGWIAASNVIRCYYEDYRPGEYKWLNDTHDDAFRCDERGVLKS